MVFRAELCTCDVTDEENDSRTQAMGVYISQLAMASAPRVELCDRQLLIACVLAAVHIGGMAGRNTGEIKTSINEAARYARHLVDLHAAQARQLAGQPANQNQEKAP